MAGGINLFSYVENNPLNYIDPEGLKLLLQGSAEDRQTLLDILSNIAGTKLSMNEDGCVSGDFNSPEGFSEAGNWLKEIINSDAIVKVTFGDASWKAGGKFNMDTGVATIDNAFKKEGQKKYWYNGMPRDWIDRIFGTGPAHFFTQEDIVAHEVLGHGLDYARGDHRNNQQDAIARANKVRQSLGLPIRYN